ncbi:uncharacterized protein LOC123296090 [Chrysoperla carnea]|uniref:uncharacterized protein LOC123296090 n=1 Tax=Chrysoperla carnea TaxID=189513 RepID=UPI001D07D395|nr:uncharacterized protein LOC123296090 [Chrysoperla carnea]
MCIKESVAVKCCSKLVNNKSNFDLPNRTQIFALANESSPSVPRPVLLLGKANERSFFYDLCCYGSIESDSMILYQKRLRKERKIRKRIQDQLEIEMKRKTQLEDALKSTPAGTESLRLISESLAQELELERKSRQQQVDSDVKSPLQDRANYYKNSVLFTSAT